MKKIISLILFATANILFAQNNGIGINTSDPQETLHVKSNKAFILGVSDGNFYDGNYTIASADTEGTFKIEKTDVFRSVKLIQTNNQSNEFNLNPDIFGNWETTEHTFELEPGRWALNITSLLTYNNNDGLKDSNGISLFNKPIVVVEITIGNEIGNSITNDLEGNTPGSVGGVGIVRGSIVSPLETGMLKGIIILNNKTSTSKVYKILVRNKVINLDPNDQTIRIKKIKDVLVKGISQNQFYAVPLN